MNDTITNHSQIIEEYLMNREIAETSKRTYRCIINNFFSSMIKNGGNASKPGTPDAIAYKFRLEQSGKSHYTVVLYMMAIRTFFNWMVQAGMYDKVITQGMKRMRKSTAYTKLSLNNEQVHKLISMIDDSTLIGKRDKLMISLALTTGLRVIEISRILLSDITGNQIRVQRKGYTTKSQIINITKPINTLISDYITERLNNDEEVSNDSPLFVGHAKAHRALRLQGNAISGIIKGRLIKAGMNDKRITAHSLRHTCAVMLVQEGNELAVIQHFLGHSSIVTTQIYTRFAEYNLLDAAKPHETLTKLFLT